MQVTIYSIKLLVELYLLRIKMVDMEEIGSLCPKQII
jgi:hypothetical protein